MELKKLILMLVIAAGANLSACSDDKTSANNVIKIATAAPLSGESANAGKDHESGARLAVEEINTAGGVEVGGKKYMLELISEDDGGDAKQGAFVAQKIVDNKSISAVIGHYNSGVTQVAQPIYAKNNLALLTISTNPDLTIKAKKSQEGTTLLYRLDAHDGQQGSALADYIKNKGFKKLAIIDDATTYGKGIADQVEKRSKEIGLDLFEREAVTHKTTNFKNTLTKIKSSGADAIMWAGYDETAATLVKQARELGLSAALLMPDAACTNNFIALAGAAADGTICSVTGIPLSDMKDGADFSTRFEKRFAGLKVQGYAAYTYDAVLTLVAAIKKVESVEPEKIAKAMKNLDVDGLSGAISFDEVTGERKGAYITIQEVKNNALVTIDRVK